VQHLSIGLGRRLEDRLEPLAGAAPLGQKSMSTISWSLIARSNVVSVSAVVAIRFSLHRVSTDV